MGHSLLCAAFVLRRRAASLKLALLMGCKGLPDSIRPTLRAPFSKAVLCHCKNPG